MSKQHTEITTIRFTKAQNDALTAFLAKHGMTKSSFIRKAVQNEIARYGLIPDGIYPNARRWDADNEKYIYYTVQVVAPIENKTGE